MALVGAYDGSFILTILVTMKNNLASQPGIVLRKIPYSESDEIISVVMRDDGLRRFFVAGARKSKTRYQGVIDIFAHLNLHYQTSDRGLWRLMSADSIGKNSFQAQPDIEIYAFSCFLSELICELAPEEVNDHHFYDQWMSFEDLVKQERFERSLVPRILLQVFSSTGYALLLDQCVQCDTQNLPEKVGFDPLKGGVICSACMNRPNVVYDLRFLVGNQSGSEFAEPVKRLIADLVYFSQNIMQKTCRSAQFYLDLLKD